MRRHPILLGLALILTFELGLLEVVSAGTNLEGFHRWGYQLQEADPVEISTSSYDLVVIDYSRDGTDATAYTPEEIQSIKDSGKIVLAYISIGEAEDYRFYWKPWWRPGIPFWLGPENPQWPGNYKVRYWFPGWWSQVIRPYLDKILEAGFDGVYLDIIDAYWYWHQAHHLPVAFTANRMVSLVGQIAAYCRSQVPNFIICPQNGESIIDDASTNLAVNYLTTIDAIGVEDLFYHYGTQQDQKYRMELLQIYADNSILVFNVEYIAQTEWTDYENQICRTPFPVIPYAADPDRALNELINFPEVFCSTTNHGRK